MAASTAEAVAEAAGATNAVLFAEPLILLGAAVLMVPLAKRLGLGSVLGYLAAGVIIGPLARLISEPEQILHVSELGVVMFLFIIGLELKPSKLWTMRRDIFGMGAAQVGVTGVVLSLGFFLFGWRLEPALIIGFGLAMSSTAYGMQDLAEKNDLKTAYGQKSFSILLFQDIAIVPLLALVPLMSPGSTDNVASSGVVEVIKLVVATGLLLLAGRFLLNPMFRLLAATKAREIMTAAALLVVLAAAAIMDMAGMSMAMGAFIAGVMLADSSFRHELEANIEPFRGLLLGLFFIAVGMSINLSSVLLAWWRIILVVPIVMLLKGAILYGLNRLFGASHNNAVRTATLLPQAGEFAFVLFASAAATRALWPSETSFVAAIVTFSMALTPLSLWLSKFLLIEEDEDAMEEDFEGAGGEVLVIGFGRFGQIVSQVLLARNVNVTIIEANAERIRQAARFGFRIYFGDGTRIDVLRAAGAEEAKLICVCVDERETTNRIVDILVAEFDQAEIYARAWDRAHTLELIEKGVDYELRETYESGLVFGGEALMAIGFDREEVQATLEDVRRRDAERLSWQRSGDFSSGRHLMHPQKVEPEPLVPPEKHRGRPEEEEDDDVPPPPARETERA
ncbi:monovalent cation:proton antiporter-2 (CPA2) family protein [Afifella marina]|uniref:Monovalent cation:H+ antiporter-2, CPA2 family n=1 Tax=Afifella marina DSM 2698 TaxID=1120955 RepID=A0A1G5M9L4_AFIMA|nr:monovalent cation:proton antiporter-2 (CPA2) family protein [Afifella marina]MBK1622768.1 potassium transporter TrkA [Afifella marina DSM 2698]MBK1625763.1 potassium transporter TrkA [Afifella marina]MBK5917586.1 potassium transporter TrkA [Afifella marina]RAI23516.1 potassium transporter TrkA [Afifella marina DSM 2698]SCZ21786.1 monovalent cation:H+ antiporter-2, CPA2 family [Afifella marina DSM 2698]